MSPNYSKSCFARVRRVRWITRFTQARHHAIEIGGLDPKVRHAKARPKRPDARVGRLLRSHAWRELADDQELSA